MTQDRTIIFVCEHGAAKSIIAATYFNSLAEERNLSARAIARGITPEQELSAKAVEGLRRDGLTPNESVPQKLTLVDVESAEQIVSFSELPEEYQERIIVEQWNDVPPVNEDYAKARNAILAKLRILMNSIL
jgi:protein-tyrosine-phosphatase